MTNGKYNEDSKFNQFDYIREYFNLMDSLGRKGFLEDSHPVPTVDGQIVNGAHRLAICIAQGLPIYAEEVARMPEIQDSELLRKRGFPNHLVDYLMLEYIKIKCGVRAYVLLDSSEDILRIILKNLPSSYSILGVKALNLSSIGKRRIVDLMYSHNEWWELDLLESFVKERFTENLNQTFIIFYEPQAHSEIQEVKERLRGFLPAGNFERKLHGTDEHFDTCLLATASLNRNSVDFLNNAPFGSESRIKSLMDTQQNFSDLGTPVLVGSGPLELFGIRQARDLDWIFPFFPGKSKSSDHLDADLNGYAIDRSKFIDDPSFFGQYKDIKFASLSATLFWKTNRREKKDIHDLELISEFLSKPRMTYSNNDIKAVAHVLENKTRILYYKNQVKRLVPNKIKVFLKGFFLRVP